MRVDAMLADAGDETLSHERGHVRGRNVEQFTDERGVHKKFALADCNVHELLLAWRGDVALLLPDTVKRSIINVSYIGLKVDAMANWSAGGRVRGALLLIFAALWLGMLVGVSFLATSAKFLAPSLTLPVALDVGRHTFAVFNKVEWVLAAATLLMFVVGARALTIGVGLAAATGLLLAETVWLLPALDARVGMIIAGQQPPPSQLHEAFIAFEAIKVVALLLVVAEAARRLVRVPLASAPQREGAAAR